MGDLQGAKENFERALKIAKSRIGENHPDVARYLNNLGTVVEQMGDFQRTKEMYERALKIDEVNFGENHPALAIQTYNLANAMFDLGKIDDARLMYERSLKIHETVFGPNHPKAKELKIILDGISDVPSDLFTNPDTTELEKIASFLISKGELKSAKKFLERALSILEKNLAENDAKLAKVVGQLKNLMKDMGDFNGAKEMFERLLMIYEDNFGVKHLKTATIIHELAEIHYELGDLNGTKEMLQRALKIYKVNFPKDHPNLSIAFSNLSSLMKELGDMNGRKEMLEHAIKIDQVNFNRDDALYVTDIEDIPLISRLQFTGYPADLKIRQTSRAVSELRNQLGDFNEEELLYLKSFYEVALKVFEANLGSNLALGKLYNRFGKLLLAENKRV
jgi:tetratricopeptide (TPR) repeat protein